MLLFELYIYFRMLASEMNGYLTVINLIDRV